MSFEHLKAGDKVIVRGHRDYLRKVERVTATQIIDDNGSRFRRKDGGMVGYNGWHSSRLIEYSEAEEQKIVQKEHRSRLLYKISVFDLTRCSIDQLERIVAIYNEGKE